MAHAEGHGSRMNGRKEGFSVRRCQVRVTYSDNIGSAKLVGDAAVFVEPPAARLFCLFQKLTKEAEI